jgi:acid phosphatase (class A)
MRSIRYGIWLMAAGLAAGTAASAGGYLDAKTSVDASKFLPPPPMPGSAAYAADRYVFDATRKLQGTDRWKLAASDNDLDVDPVVADFDCALGFTPTRKTTPHLFALFENIRSDAGYAIDSGKNFFKKKRPLIGNNAPICVDRKNYEKSYSYPSGHSTLSWTYTLILAELVPDRITDIAARGRAYGESRAVCGVHWASDVEAGRVAASVVFAALNGNTAFRADMAAAKKEIAALRRTGVKPDAATCAIPDAAAAKRPW